MGRVIPLGSSDDEEDTKPLLLKPRLSHHQPPQPPPPRASSSSAMDKPRRSIYPPPSVNKQEDVKPVINKALWTGVLDNLGGLLNEQKEDRKPLAAGSRFGEHPDEDSKRQMSGELAYQVKQRQKQELALRIANLDQEVCPQRLMREGGRGVLSSSSSLLLRSCPLFSLSLLDLLVRGPDRHLHHSRRSPQGRTKRSRRYLKRPAGLLSLHPTRLPSQRRNRLSRQ